jgi:hypothetical protein
MSISDNQIILGRVMSGSSPIALFNGLRLNDVSRRVKTGQLDAVFANTVKTVNEINNHDINYIMTIDSRMTEKEIKGAISAASSMCKMHN